jgi:type I protein arginine methyltransferase
MQAYRAAIHQRVKPGHVVLDLGAGSGILSFHACQAGASRVYAVEHSDIANLIPQMAADNGLDNRIVVRKGWSLDLDLPERVDVVIASMLDSFGININMLETVQDACKRLLKPGGTLIPATVRLSYCPVEIPEWYQANIDCWNAPRLGFRMGAARAVATNQPGAIKIRKEALLSTPLSFDEINLSQIQSTSISAEGSVVISRPGVFHGLAGWFETVMAEGIRCGNSPLDEARLPWANMIFPVERAVNVSEGDRIEAGIRAVTLPRRMVWVWNARVFDTSGELKADFHHSSFHGEMTSKDDLTRLGSRFIPVSSERNKAARMVLQYCDGKSSISEIADKVRASFPKLFATQLGAEAFVASILSQ